MRSYPNTQPFTSLVWFRIKQSGGFLNPRIWWSLNLRIWESLNPRIWGSLNSRIWASLNPRIWGSLNPRIWGSLHHRISGSLNPRIWGSLYPRIWGSLILCINNNISKMESEIYKYFFEYIHHLKIFGILFLRLCSTRPDNLAWSNWFFL